MASEVSICNSALDKLGAARITDLTDNSRNARACSSAYERSRDALLRKHRWNFSIARAQLAADATDPEFGYDFQYTLPVDCLRVLEPYHGFRRIGENRIIEGRKIITDETAPLDLRYVSKVTDPNVMDSLFLEVLAVEIAIDICEELTQSNTKKSELRDLKKELLAEARKANAVERDPDVPPEDEWITVRR
jgi:hypothetical protein